MVLYSADYITTTAVQVIQYLFEEVRSKYSPSFFHLTTGCGYPLGGAHLRIVSSPTETSVSFGRIRKSSRMSADTEKKDVNTKREVSI